MNNADKAAFPQHKLDNVTGKVSQQQSRGLTKRERFAMAAMQGISTNIVISDGTWRFSEKEIAEYAAATADALLNELEK